MGQGQREKKDSRQKAGKDKERKIRCEKQREFVTVHLENTKNEKNDPLPTPKKEKEDVNKTKKSLPACFYSNRYCCAHNLAQRSSSESIKNQRQTKHSQREKRKENKVIKRLSKKKKKTYNILVRTCRKLCKSVR